MKKKCIGALLTACLMMSLVAAPLQVYAETTQEKLAKADEHIAQLQEEMDEVKVKKENKLEEKYIMDQRNAALQEKIDLLNVAISETTARIEENEAAEQAQYELFCRQAREEEERGTVSYWSVLFKATGFVDLLSRLDFVSEVMDHDQEVINELRRIRDQLDADRAELQAQQEELDAAKEELAAQIAEADKLIEEFTATEEGLKKAYEEEKAAAEQLRIEIDEAERQAMLAAQAAQAASAVEAIIITTPGNSGGYIWPTNDTRYITSPVGFRSAATTNYIGTTSHEGVDIGAPYGTNILASKAGTVIQSGWYGGYGYCVTIQHGAGGYYTRYAHMSQIFVDYGQTVEQGQVIGLVGNTGNSNGAHIHFEIHEAGMLQDPLMYLGGYIPLW